MSLTGSLSMVARGTAFEERSLHLLQTHLSMSLSRVGGASDGGIDLHGWWWLPSSKIPHPKPMLNANAATLERRRLRVLAQCKAYAKKTGPNVIREMEGVLFRHRAGDGVHLPEISTSCDSNKGDSVAVIISKSQFTKQTILRTMSSKVPFLLLHLPEIGGLDSSSSWANAGCETSTIGSILWNDALSGSDGLLGGQFEIRWIRSPKDGIGRPSIWKDGHPVTNWAPV